MNKFGLVLAGVSIAFSARAEITSGKYFCLVSHLAGIQLTADGSERSGNFNPAEDKFFIDVHAAAHPSNVCTGPKTGEFSEWFLCAAKYEIRISDRRNLRGDVLGQFVGAQPYNDTFLLSADGSFNSFQAPFSTDGYYVSDGKCTKIQ